MWFLWQNKPQGGGLLQEEEGSEGLPHRELSDEEEPKAFKGATSVSTEAANFVSIVDDDWAL